MRLVTFQSLEALKDLLNKGYLECNINEVLERESIGEKTFIKNYNNTSY